MEKFKGVSPHRPLAEDGSEIRIVNLLPGSFNSPIVCELEHIKLAGDREYEAVSYSWGNPTVTRPITLDGRIYPVTVNLLAGLRYFRYADSSRYLWIDCLCINQSDMAERSREIPKMRDIYRHALNVLIWIGDYAPFTRDRVKKDFQYVADLAMADKEHEQTQVIRKYGLENMWGLQEELGEFLKDRSWFERMWIIQEVSVRPKPLFEHPEQCPHLLCGNLKLPFIYLSEAYIWWVLLPWSDSHLRLPDISPILDRLRNIWIGHHNMKGKGVSLALQLSWYLTMVASEFHASDHRDMIYALHGLLVEVDLPDRLSPDYTKSIQQVLLDYAVYMLESGQLIDIIQYNSALTRGIPSWVPDWKACSSSVIKLWHKPEPGTHIKVLENCQGLEVDCFTFTKVITTGPKFQGLSASQDSTVTLDDLLVQCEEAFLGHTKDFETRLKLRKRIIELAIRFDAHIRELRDTGWHTSVLKQNSEKLHVGFGYGVLSSGSSFKGTNSVSNLVEHFSAQDLWWRVAQSITERYIFECEDGSLGFVKQTYVNPCKGDIITSFHGASSEFVLRRGSGGYRLIGTCERTIKGFRSAMEDMENVREWASPACVFSILVQLWATEQPERIVLI